MNEFNNRFGATLKGFSAASPDELRQVEGGLSWGDIKRIARAVGQAINRVLNPPNNPIPPIK